jgi:hypothetical protein
MGSYEFRKKFIDLLKSVDKNLHDEVKEKIDALLDQSVSLIY